MLKSHRAWNPERDINSERSTPSMRHIVVYSFYIFASDFHFRLEIYSVNYFFGVDVLRTHFEEMLTFEYVKVIAY